MRFTSPRLSRGASPRPAYALALLASALSRASADCVDVVAGGGSSASPAAAAAAATATTGTAFPFTALAARPNSSDIAVAGRGAVYLRLSASGDIVRVAGTATSTLQAVTSQDTGLSGRPGALTPLCGEGECVGGLSFSPLDGTLVLISGGFVRALGPDGLLRVVAGTGSGVRGTGTAGDGGQATAAQFFAPSFSAVSPVDGSIFISDFVASTVRRVRPDGIILLAAGTPGVAGDSGDGGPATSAHLTQPLGLAFAPGGAALFIADGGANRIRSVDIAFGTISGFPGAGMPSGFPMALAVDPVGGALYVADISANVVRRVRLADGAVDTVAGDGGAVSTTSMCTSDTAGCPATGVSIARPKGVAVDSGGNLFVLLENAVVVHIVRFATRSASAPGNIIVFDTTQGAQVAAVEADARGAILQGSGMVEELADGSVIVIENSGQRVRRLMPNGTLILLAGGAARTSLGPFADGSPLSSLPLRSPFGVVAIPQGVAFGRSWPAFSFALSDASANIVYGVAGAVPSAPVYRLAGAADGSAATGAAGDGGPARDAWLSQPRGLDTDVDGGLIVVDAGNLRVRKISPGAVPTISTVAGGGASVSDGVSATSAMFFMLFKACVGTGGLIFIPDAGACLLRFVDPLTGLISTAAGTSGAGCGFDGDGGPASAGLLNVPVSCSRDSDGGLLIADSANSRVRKISAGALSSATISTLVGGGTLAGEGLPPLKAVLNFPTDVRRSLSGDVLIGDFGAGLVRRVLTGPRPQPCPAGYSCACIAPVPCADPASFCPSGSAAPIPVSPGYRAVAAVAAAAGAGAGAAAGLSGAATAVFTTQEICPIGYFCAGASEASPCPPGTFGVGTGQVSVGACQLCYPGTYFASDAGAAQLISPAATFGLVPPCLKCPRGSFAERAGSALCTPCRPGQTTLLPGAASPALCVPCSPANVSLFGSACVRAAAFGSGDVLVVSGSRLQLQRLVDIHTIAGDLDGPTGFALVVKLSAVAAAVGFAIALLAAVQPALPRRAAVALDPVLKSVDLVSSTSTRELVRIAAMSGPTRRFVLAHAAVQGDEPHGEAPEGTGNSGGAVGITQGGELREQKQQQQQQRSKEHTRLGVTLSAAVIVTIASVAIANSVQFFGINVDVTSALQPANPGDVDAYAGFGTFALAAEEAPTGGVDASLAEALGGLSSGLLVNVRASGARCGIVSGVTFDVNRGAFVHSVTQDAASGEASHSFACADCVPHDLSTLRFSLSRECEASAVITVSAVGAWGSISATSQVVGGAAVGGSVSLTVPVTFEVLQDLSWSDYASTLLQSGIESAGGRSARGLSVGAAQGLLQSADPQAAPHPDTVDFVLSLPLQPTFVLATLSLRTGWAGFVSSIVGLAGFVSVGGFAYGAIEAATALTLVFCGLRASARVAAN